MPDGKVSNGSDFIVNKKLERGEVFAYDAYAFNEDYEMVEGDWVFQIWHDEKKLIEQTFTTYWPDAEEIAQLGKVSTDNKNQQPWLSASLIRSDSFCCKVFL